MSLNAAVDAMSSLYCLKGVHQHFVILSGHLTRCRSSIFVVYTFNYSIFVMFLVIQSIDIVLHHC